MAKMKWNKPLAIILPSVVLASAMFGSVSTSTMAASKTSVANTPTTLTFLGGAGLGQLYQQLAAAFHKQYPKITVNVRLEADNDYNTVLPRDLISNNSPDIFAPTTITQEVKDKLVANLDQYANQYHWTSKIPSSILNWGRVNGKFVQGSGSLYEAGGYAGSVVGVFYNRAEAAKIGMKQAPRSLAQFEQDLANAKAKGLTPIVAAAQDGTINHLYNLLLGDYVGANAVNKIVFNDPTAKVNSPGALKAAQTMQKWIKAGYFNADANAVGQQASYGRFASGQGVFMFQGSWLVPVLDPMFKGKYGFFPMPPLKVGGNYTTMTGNALAFAISAKSQHKAAAALFLNWLTSPKAVQIAKQNGDYVAGKGVHAPAPLKAPLNVQFQDGYSLVATGNGFDSWIVNANPAMMPTMTAQLQLLFANKATPSQFVNSLQSTYASAQGN